MKVILIMAIVSSVGFISCSGESYSSEQTELQSETQVNKRVSKEEFADYLANNTDYQLVDVRTPSEFSGGNIQESINIDFKDKDFETNIQKLDKSKPTLVYCHAGGRSSKALSLMKTLGFDYVLELEGGFGAYE